MPNPKRPERIALTPERTQELKDFGPQLDEIARAIKAQKRLGMKMDEVEARLALVREQRKIMLEEFSA